MSHAIVTPDLSAFPGCAIVEASEPPVGAPLRIEWRHFWRRDMAAGIEPSSLRAHAQNTSGEVPRGDRIEGERDLAGVAGAHSKRHSDVQRGCREGFDLRKLRPFHLGGMRAVEGRA